MRRLGRVVVMMGVLLCLGAVDLGFSQMISPRSNVVVICRKFNVNQNCHSCSDYFYTRSEDKAIKKCERMGYEEPYYFPNVNAAFNWMLPNCSCED